MNHECEAARRPTGARNLPLFREKPAEEVPPERVSTEDMQRWIEETFGAPEPRKPAERRVPSKEERGIR